MKHTLLTISLITLLVFATSRVYAIEDPRDKPNNKIGIHILFDSELSDAAELVNSNGGDWGYALIPIQAGDKNLEKWQKFMNEARDRHIIPIIRLATEGDFFNTKVWRRPREEDILDFANFLHSLDWPTQNRYVVIFNEVNRGDEWGGEANPARYAELLSYAVTIFKSRSPNFFIISAGMDNAAPSQGTKYIDQYSYLRQMNAAVPGIFNQIDGFASHSYPNPGFSQPPSAITPKSISSFVYERSLLRQLSNKKLPIFITETGWSKESINDETQATYYQEAFATVWQDPDIVAITPFILKASGHFAQFSFLNENGTPTKHYTFIKNLSKIKGEPTLTPRILAATDRHVEPLESKKFTPVEKKKSGISLAKALQMTFAWMMKL